MKPSEAIAELTRLLRLRHYSLNTEDTYCHWVRKFFGWIRQNPEATTPRERMEGFLSNLARQDVAAATQHQAFCSILFFYRHVIGEEPGDINALRAKRPKFLRHAPTRLAISKLLENIGDTPAHPFRLIACMLYGCGLRVSEPLAIRIRDLDLDAKRVVIRQAKGGKDRMVPIPDVIMPAIRRQMAASRVVWERSIATGIPVKLPNQLGKKYPRAGQELSWWWLFPQANPCQDPRDGKTVWWHCLPSSVQKALRKAGIAAGLDGLIRPHDLRHAWATHAHDAGASIRDIQEILGHNSLETTMIYVHPDAERIPSPLNALAVNI